MVMLKKDVITIFNIIKENGVNNIIKTIVNGDFQNTQTSQIIKNSVIVSNATTVFLDKENYYPPKAFNKLTDKKNSYTIMQGDKLVKGEIKEEITKLSDIDKNYDYVITVKQVMECPHHIEIIGA